MTSRAGAVAQDETVVDQAAEVVGGAARTLLEGALRAATHCGCSRCRVHAAETFRWGVSFLDLGGGAGLPGAGGGSGGDNAPAREGASRRLWWLPASSAPATGDEER
jgi:hypothetical protein